LLNCFKVPSDIDSAICGTFTIVSTAMAGQQNLPSGTRPYEPLLEGVVLRRATLGGARRHLWISACCS
jgi:hypothetical protein